MCVADIKSSLLDLIGKTPIMQISRFQSHLNINSAKVLAKLEFLNPIGSIKDRVAEYMIKDAEQSGKLTPGTTIIEATNGNTGLGIAAIASLKGYKVIFTMPETVPSQWRNLLKAYGAETILTDGKKGMSGAIDMAKILNKQIDKSVIMDQLDNPANPQAHFETTGPEIWNDTDGEVDIFVSAVGSGGTFSGAGGFLKMKNPDIKNIIVEPYSSPVISQGESGVHKIHGIGFGFIPETLNLNVCDAVITVKDEEAYDYAKIFAKTEGMLVGLSSGAALCAVHKLTKMDKYADKTIAVILPDSGERYISGGIGLYD